MNETNTEERQKETDFMDAAMHGVYTGHYKGNKFPSVLKPKLSYASVT